MKHYIFLSYITGSGGVQCYVAAKAKYLEENGWRVLVISHENPNSKIKCLIEYLNKFVPYGIPTLLFHPCEIPRFMVNKTLDKMIKSVGILSAKDDVIVESWNSNTALWGELLASKLKGRHIFWTANEIYRSKGSSYYNLYEEKIDFYKYKMDRGEIFTSLQPVNRLFEGYREYKKGDFIECPITENPIQDIKTPAVDNIVNLDWNICYVGRSSKSYVPNIFRGVGEFSKKHYDKSIQFIVVGNVTVNGDVLDEIRNIQNLKITELGDLYPIPRSLYGKVDVIIAGSGSARHSADEGVLVITADTEQHNSHGLLGYDTNESIYSENNNSGNMLNLSFEEALERVLVKETWRKQTNIWKKGLGISECTAIQFDIISKAESEMKYFDEDIILKGKKNYFRYLRSLLRNFYIDFKALF